MNRVAPARLALLAFGLVAAITGVVTMTGALYANRYEGDLLHLMDIVLRMADGQMPHLDFMTPIGWLAVWPIAVFAETGMGFAHAVFYGQAMVALALAPLAVWVATSRFSGWTAYAYVALVVIFPLALVSGGSDANISLSMHYNRWAWAAAFIAVPVAVLPPLRSSALADGLVLGLALAALALIKVTYVVALVPGIVVLLIVRRAFAALGIGVATGLGALAIFTLWAGLPLWAAYIGDLLATATSETRDKPGLDLPQLLTGPAFLAGHAAALAAIIFLRRSEQAVMGLGLLLLLPGFVFITYQNFGNDPQWMALLGLILLQGLPREPGPRTGLTVAGIALIAFALPSVSNLAFSPLRNNAKDPAEFVQVIPGATPHLDLMTPVEGLRSNRMQTAADHQFPSLAALSGRYPDLDASATDDTDTDTGTVAGVTLEDCEFSGGVAGPFHLIAADLVALGHAGTPVFVTDLLSSIWLFHDAIPPVHGAAPWRYAGLPGLDAAELILVPRCPVSVSARRAVLSDLKALEGQGMHLDLVAERELYLLLRPSRGTQTEQSQALASADQPTAQIAR